LFKTALLNEIPSSDSEYGLFKYGAIIEQAINDTMSRVVNSKINEASFDTDLSRSATYIDMQPTFNGGIINPNKVDLYPIVTIVDDPLYSINDVPTTIQPPSEYHIPIPLMHIYPAIYNMFSFQKVYSKYDEKQLYYNGNTNPFLEISIYSIIDDVKILVSEYDSATKTLTTIGHDMLTDIINKYTECTITLILVNLMKNHNASQEIINEFHTIFQTAYQNAFKVQHAMYTILDNLFRTRLGICIARLRSIEYATCSIDLLYDNCISSDIWVYINTLITHYYIDQIKYTQGFLFSDEIKTCYCENKTALGRIVKATVLGVLSSILDYLDQPLMFKPNIYNSIKTRVSNIVNSIHNGPSATVIKMQVLNIVSNNTNKQSNMFKKTLLSMIQSLSSDNIIEKLEKAIDPTFQYGANNYGACINACPKLYKDNPLITEHTNILKEIYTTNKSNTAMREILTRTRDISSYEEAFGLTMDIESYLDILDHNSFKETEDSFKLRFLLTESHTKAAQYIESTTH
jgi:hypothetical protein